VSPRRRSALAKYLVLQLPGWTFVALLLGFLMRSTELSLRVAGLLFALWIAKDFALWPILRVGYESSNASATDGLVGALGTARERLAPEGYVRVGSELWRARLTDGHGPIEVGGAVRVVAVSELTLQVEPA
jgi:membrane protein implicated in regulation of membrane protease activity